MAQVVRVRTLAALKVMGLESAQALFERYGPRTMRAHSVSWTHGAHPSDAAEGKPLCPSPAALRALRQPTT